MTGPSLVQDIPALTQEQADLQYAFPDVDPGVVPFGSRLLVQIRRPKTKTEGGILIPKDSQETEKWNTQVAKVISLGPVCFKNRDTLEFWPEGSWCCAGAFVRVAKYGGDRWEVPVPNESEPALFCFFNDLDIIGLVTGSPLTVKAFI